MMNMSAARVLHYNAMAVHSIQEGNYSKSNEILKCALLELKSIQQMREHNLEDHGHDKGDSSLSFFRSLDIGSIEISSSYRTTTDHNDDTAIFSFFNKALIFLMNDDDEKTSTSSTFSQEEEDDDVTDDDICAKVALVLLYNLGLTFQLSAAGVAAGESASSSSSSSTSISAIHHYRNCALSFYKNSMGLASLLAPSSIMRTKHKGGVLLAIMACVNNMGCIYMTMVDYKEASNCHSMLTNLYKEAVSEAGAGEGGAAAAAAGVPEEDLIFFYMTAFVFPNWQVNAAPMA